LRLYVAPFTAPFCRKVRQKSLRDVKQGRAGLKRVLKLVLTLVVAPA
jgi:hypothetical protein